MAIVDGIYAFCGGPAPHFHVPRGILALEWLLDTHYHRSLYEFVGCPQSIDGVVTGWRGDPQGIDAADGEYQSDLILR